MRLPCGKSRWIGAFVAISLWGSWAWRFSYERLEQWREKAIAGIDASLKERKGDPAAELDPMKRIDG